MTHGKKVGILSGMVVLLALISGQGPVVSPPPGEGPTVPGRSSYGANGSVLTQYLDSSRQILFIGGSFTRFGPMASGGLALDAVTGQPTVPLATLPKVEGFVADVVPDGSGGWYIGGRFSRVGTTVRNNIARINSDGSVAAWNPNADGYVFSLAVSGSTVYAGGEFTTIGGQARNNLAALDAHTGLATTWNPDTNDWVSSMAVSGATVYVVGQFTSIGGQRRNNLAALDAHTGLATAWNPNSNGTVHSLAEGGGTVFVGGDFTSIGGQRRMGIAALDAATGAVRE